MSDAPMDLTCISVHAAEGWVLCFRNLGTRPRSRSASNARTGQLFDWLQTSFNRGRFPTSHNVPETESRARAHKAKVCRRARLAGSKRLTQNLAGDKSEREVRPGRRYRLLQAGRPNTARAPERSHGSHGYPCKLAQTCTEVRAVGTTAPAVQSER